MTISIALVILASGLMGGGLGFVMGILFDEDSIADLILRASMASVVWYFILSAIALILQEANMIVYNTAYPFTRGLAIFIGGVSLPTLMGVIVGATRE